MNLAGPFYDEVTYKDFSYALENFQKFISQELSHAWKFQVEMTIKVIFKLWLRYTKNGSTNSCEKINYDNFDLFSSAKFR